MPSYHCSPQLDSVAARPVSELCPPAVLTSAHRLHIMPDHIYYFLTVSTHLVCGHLIKTVIMRHSNFICSNVTTTISLHAPLSRCPSGYPLQIGIGPFQPEGCASTLCQCFDIVTLSSCWDTTCASRHWGPCAYFCIDHTLQSDDDPCGPFISSLTAPTSFSTVSLPWHCFARSAYPPAIYIAFVPFTDFGNLSCPFSKYSVEWITAK